MSSGIRDRIIEILREHQGSHIPQAYIHRALGVSKSRVSEILSELEREGLISRISIGRSKVIYIYPGLSERVTHTRVNTCTYHALLRSWRGVALV
jgi:predicted transcriptional regulator